MRYFPPYFLQQSGNQKTHWGDILTCAYNGTAWRFLLIVWMVKCLICYLETFFCAQTVVAGDARWRANYSAIKLCRDLNSSHFEIGNCLTSLSNLILVHSFGKTISLVYSFTRPLSSRPIFSLIRNLATLVVGDLLLRTGLTVYARSI